MAIKINPQAAQRPDGKPGDDRKKEPLNEPFMPDEPEEGKGEVSGRDRRWVPGVGWRYVGYWHFGNYIWLCDGLAYQGWHWHPNPFSPGAWDEDGC